MHSSFRSLIYINFMLNGSLTQSIAAHDARGRVAGVGDSRARLEVSGRRRKVVVQPLLHASGSNPCQSGQVLASPLTAQRPMLEACTASAGEGSPEAWWSGFVFGTQDAATTPRTTLSH